MGKDQAHPKDDPIYELPLSPPKPLSQLKNVLTPSSSDAQDIEISADGHVSSIDPSSSFNDSPYKSCLVLPSLCHPHIHLDKPYLLTHPSTCQLQPETGTFSEALSITSKSKELFDIDSVLDRMNTLLADSIGHGVTAIRAFCEVDSTVNLVCLRAGLIAKKAWRERCEVQICAFAQDPLFSGPSGDKNRSLMEQALQLEDVEVLGATPYVEADEEREKLCIQWAVETSKKLDKLLDFHLDYNVDISTQPRVWDVLRELREQRWVQGIPTIASGALRTVCLGHCTRLMLFEEFEWNKLREEVKGLPIYFIGLPTSDMFMMGRPSEGSIIRDRTRTTLQIPSMIQYGLKGAIAVNNVGNAFTPYGSGDPIELARWGIGIYQDGTSGGAELLFECISKRAREAIGLAPTGESTASKLKVGQMANFVLVGKPEGKESPFYRRRRTVKEVVWDSGNDRTTIFKGKLVVIDS